MLLVRQLRLFEHHAEAFIFTADCLSIDRFLLNLSNNVAVIELLKELIKGDLLIILIIVLSHYMLKTMENSARLFDVNLYVSKI